MCIKESNLREILWPNCAWPAVIWRSRGRPHAGYSCFFLLHSSSHRSGGHMRSSIKDLTVSFHSILSVDMADFSVTHSVLSMLSDHWHTGHVTHTDISVESRYVCYELSYTQAQVFRTATVLTDCPCLLSQHKFTVCEVCVHAPAVRTCVCHVVSSSTHTNEDQLFCPIVTAFFMYCNFTGHGSVSFFVLCYFNDSIVY